VGRRSEANKKRERVVINIDMTTIIKLSLQIPGSSLPTSVPNNELG